ncbi:iron ABC transporter permease [Vibrio hepatarius]|nr:iron ABC transporter permease [Vibrio hepatarius]
MASLVLIVTAIASIALGPISISLNQVFISLLNLFGWQHISLAETSSYLNVVIGQIRLPRTLLCIAVGSILAICGAVMQGLFRNPLADPSILGVSSGASVGAALSIVAIGVLKHYLSWLPPSTVSLWLTPMMAFWGALAATILVYKLGTISGRTSVNLMLLGGIAVSSIAGAIIGLLSYIADDQQLRALSFWQMGSLEGATWPQISLCWASLIGLVVYFQRQANALNALLLGEAEAGHLGINVNRLKLELIAFTAFGVSIAVSVSGIIGFVGLVVPHLIRLVLGPSHCHLLPLSALLGAILLLFSDIISRTLITPAQLPVGIVTAAIGAPFFIFLLMQQRQRFGG